MTQDTGDRDREGKGWGNFKKFQLTWSNWEKKSSEKKKFIDDNRTDAIGGKTSVGIYEQGR